MRRLYRRDEETGQEGYTLAAILLLGLEEMIQSALPYQATRTLRAASELRNAVEHERLREVNSQFRPLVFTHIHCLSLTELVQVVLF